MAFILKLSDILLHSLAFFLTINPLDFPRKFRVIIVKKKRERGEKIERKKVTKKRGERGAVKGALFDNPSMR